MDISSLFKDKAYSFREISDNEEEKNFAKITLNKFLPDFNIKKIDSSVVFDHYDIFSVYNQQNEKFTFKISLDDSENILKKESTFLKNHKSAHIPELVKNCRVKIGDEMSCLLSRVPEGENIRNHGRSIILNQLQEFRDSYTNVFLQTKTNRRSYKGYINSFCDKLNPEKFLNDESINSFKAYTDYDLCVSFIKELKKQIKNSLVYVYEDLNYNCHTGMSLDSIFYGSGGFYYDYLHNVSRGHPLVDFIDILLELGVSSYDDKRLAVHFCEELKIKYDQNIYDSIYQVQLRKKLAELVISYIKEVYLFDSFRYERIFYIADTFSHCYKRFCSIDIFEKNKEFIMKTICEPIFGVKA